MAKSIIVLWLREEDLRKFPLRKISELKAFLKVQQDQKIKIIGPYSSDMLHDMVNEACPFIVVPPQEKCGTTSKQDSRPDLTNVRFYSYGASAPDSQLLGNLNGTVQGYFDKFDTRILQRTIANDDTLAHGIVSELKRRQVDPGHRAADHVALISEWDTFYGQTLPQAVEREFSPRHPRPGWHCQHRHGLDPPCIHKFTYLRGLDGLLPSAESKEDTKQDKATPQGEQQAGAAGFFKTQPDANNLDRPVGQGQFDYLRRMSKDLHKTDEELRKEGRKLKVVGILGSDVFDKLLILRALRPEFPEALFFTTDFDEAFSIESELPWTRNLIISSSFGPILNKTIQREIPSFRDSYQTSTFLATLLAIGDPANKWETPEIVSKSLAEQLSFPRIFEIERKGDVLSFNKVPPVAPAPQNHEQKQEECPTNSGDCKAKIAGPLIQGLSLAEGGAQGVTPDCGKSTHPWYCDGIQIQPPVEKLFPTFEEGTRTKLAAGLALLAVLVWVALHFRKVPEGALVEVWLVVLGFGLAFWERLARRLTENGEGEPIALLQGVSVWPTVLLRVFGILLSVYFICRAQRSLQNNLAEIAKEMELNPTVDKLDWSKEITTFFQDMRILWHKITSVFREKRTLRIKITSILPNMRDKVASLFDFSLESAQADPALPPDVDGIWRAYVGQERFWSRRFWRAFLYTVVMMVIYYIVLRPLFGESTIPVRSELAYNVYKNWTVLPDVISSLFLTFSVFDATFFCLLFVNKLRGTRTEWPTDTIELFNDRLRLQTKPVHEWIGLEFVAKRTRCIGSLIYYPFVLIVLLIVSRSTVFANYAPCLTNLIAAGISLSVVFGCAIMLWWAATAARDAAKQNLTDGIIAARGHFPKVADKSSDATQNDSDDNPCYAEQLETLWSRVDQLKDGAFRPFSQQPLVRALLWPFGSFGWTALIQNGMLPGL